MTATKTILFIDDQKICHKILELALKNNSEYKLLNAYSGEEALKIIEQHAEQISVIISDVIMNDYSGHYIFQQTQQNPKTQNIPFILQSGFNCDSQKLAYPSGKQVPIIYKPYKSEELFSIIEQLL